MYDRISRNTFLGGLVTACGAVGVLGVGNNHQHKVDEIARLERRYGGRLGIAIFDGMNRSFFLHRADERFALCSTFKFLAATFVLSRVDQGHEHLARRIAFSANNLVAHSPITAKHAGSIPGMSVAELCDAMLRYSDNSAGNLILQSFGGPAALTAYVRSQGDAVTRLDRNETSLNENLPDDSRDTTTPRAMLQNMSRILLGSQLSSSSRTQLTAWLDANTTGDARLRAGIPADWRIGDKTGSGDRGATNDIAILRPPGRAPILVAAYYSESRASDDQRNTILAAVGRIAALG